MNRRRRPGEGKPPRAKKPLIEAAREGDRKALGRLYARYRKVLYKVAFRLTNSWSDSQDVLQDVFVGLPGALTTYEGRGSFERWLVQLTTRTALMKLRARKRRREVSLGQLRRSANPTADADPIDHLALDGALGLLPDEQRSVVVLRLLKGYTHEQVAETLGISVGASRARLCRALRTLRHALDGPSRGGTR